MNNGDLIFRVVSAFIFSEKQSFLLIFHDTEEQLYIRLRTHASKQTNPSLNSSSVHLEQLLMLGSYSSLFVKGSKTYLPQSVVCVLNEMMFKCLGH